MCWVASWQHCRPRSIGLFYELGADHVPVRGWPLLVSPWPPCVLVRVACVSVLRLHLVARSTFAHTPVRAQAAMYAVPVGMLVDVFFLLCWRTLLPRVPNEWSTLKQIGVMVAVTLTVWVVLAVIVAVFLDVVLQSPGALALAGTGALLSSGCTGVIACLHPPASPKGTNAVSRAMLAARGVCAGVAVSTAVMLSDLSGVVGGIFSVFPAIFFTTMVVCCVTCSSWHPCAQLGLVFALWCACHRLTSSLRWLLVQFSRVQGLWISQGDGVPLGELLPP